MGRRWHILRAEGEVILARHLPARFDVALTTWLPAGDPVSFAHQIRQDLWRLFQKLRGFSPVVKLSRAMGGWDVCAGGRVLCPVSATDRLRGDRLLADPTVRTRWVRHANRGRL